jgi:hypothetical protein
VSQSRRESVADWLMILGATGLFGSLFLTWSHQFSAGFLAQFAASGALQGVPRDPTAWQLYSVADGLLALLAIALCAVALRGGRSARLVVLLGLMIALAFTLHALSDPPTNGANVSNPSLSVPNYAANSPSAGFGETVAITGLGLAIVGLGLSMTLN